MLTLFDYASQSRRDSFGWILVCEHSGFRVVVTHVLDKLGTYDNFVQVGRLTEFNKYANDEDSDLVPE